MKKVMVIGLDGATFNIINPLIKQGKLPTIKKLIENGSYGISKTFLPPNSTLSWTSLTTGKNPGKHTIVDFFHLKNKDYTKILNNSHNVKADRIWNLIGNNKKSIAINIPLTYPAHNINGIMLTGLFTPEDESFANNKEIEQEIKKNIGEYIIDTTAIKSNEPFLEKLYRTTDQRYKTAKYLRDNKEWDFFMVVFTSLDRAQHVLWDKPELLTYYEKIDEIVKGLIEGLEDTYIIICSDHGFTKREGNLYLNNWLEKKGYLKRKKLTEQSNELVDWEDLREKSLTNKTPKKLFVSTGITQSRIKDFLTNIGLLKLIRKFNLNKLKKILPVETHTIDWENTKAYTNLSNNAIALNLASRNSKGIVKDEEIEPIRNKIIEDLKELKNDQGKKIALTIHKKEDFYSGPYLNQLPELFIWFGGYKASQILSKKIITSEDADRGFHDLEGIFIINGKDIAKNNYIGKNTVLDITPTLLYLLDKPIPEDIDGKILKEIITKDSSILKRKPKILDKTEMEKQRILGVIKKIK